MAAWGLAMCGCGQETGWVLKPVPIDEQLRETVLTADPGWGVTDKIAVLDVDGLLMNQREAGWFGEKDNPVSLFVEKLDNAEADGNVKAIILRINSPGGGVTASDIMHERLMRFRSARKLPVIAVLEDVGASGAYYLACASDEIVANPTTITGSIGVIVQTVSFSGTMRLLGISAKAVTSGPRKDMASPLKPLDEKDLAILQTMVDEFYKRFLEVVVAGRPKLSAEKVKSLADGRVYTGEQALANGLVDRIGYMEDAIRLAKQRGGISKAKVVMYHRPLGYRANVYSAAPMAAGSQVNLLNINVPDAITLSQPKFLYLWTGHAAQ